MADQKPKYSFQLIDPDDIKVVRGTEYLIENLFVLRELTFVYGAPKQFKTFFVLAALLCVALGIDFLGRKVKQCKVVYMIGEGGDAFLGRIKAWQALNKIESLKKNFLVIDHTVNLFDDDGVNSVRQAVRDLREQGFQPDVAAIDTLGRAMGDADEKTKDFNKIFVNLDRLRQDWPGLTEIVLSHTKKGEAVFRGPQVIAGNGDNLMYVIRDGLELRATVTCEGGFFRNAREFEAFGFTLAPQKVLTTVGMQDFLTVDGLTEAVKPAEGTGAKKTDKELRQEELDELIWLTALQLRNGPDQLVEYNAWFQLTKAHRGGKLGTTTFSDAVKRLIAQGTIRKVGKFYQVVLDGRGDGSPEQDEGGRGPTPVTPAPDSRSPIRGAGVPGVGSATPRSTPGAPGVNSTGNGNGKVSVVPDAAANQAADAAQDAVQQLLKGKTGKPS
jgi:hypothetical protein